MCWCATLCVKSTLAHRDPHCTTVYSTAMCVFFCARYDENWYDDDGVLYADSKNSGNKTLGALWMDDFWLVSAFVVAGLSVLCYLVHCWRAFDF